jgi:transcription-repair coupling factor (superfamily II helicase)
VIERIRKLINESEPFYQLAAAMNSLRPGGSLRLHGLSGSLIAFAGAQMFELRKTQVLLVAADRDRAEQLRDDCATLLGDDHVCLYVSGPQHAAMHLDMSAPIAQIETLRSLSSSKCVLVVASAEALTTKLPPKNQFAERAIELSVHKEYPFEQLIQKLITMSFAKKDFVEEYGDFAVRGGILDVFPFIGDNPIRFEFWGDTVESIREFDVLSQRSIRELQTASIVANLRPDTLDPLQNPEGSDQQGTHVSLFEYLSSDALLILDEPAVIEKEIEELRQEGYTNILDWKAIEEKAHGFARIDHATIQQTPSVNRIDFHSHPQPPIAGSIKRLIEYIQKVSKQGHKV